MGGPDRGGTPACRSGRGFQPVRLDSRPRDSTGPARPASEPPGIPWNGTEQNGTKRKVSESSGTKRKVSESFGKNRNESERFATVAETRKSLGSKGSRAKRAQLAVGNRHLAIRSRPSLPTLPPPTEIRIPKSALRTARCPVPRSFGCQALPGRTRKARPPYLPPARLFARANVLP